MTVLHFGGPLLGPTRLALCLSSALMLGACATGPDADPRDPLEPYNRTMFKVNDAVDRAVFRPVAQGYVNVVPTPIRSNVSNFFGNLGDVWSAINNLLQLKGQDAVESVLRFTTNTVFGFAGLFDVASEMGLSKHKQDFGLTLGHWGVPTGPYFVLPLLGPSTIRDTAALPVDTLANPVSVGQINDVRWRNSLFGVRVLDTRAQLLQATDFLDDAALDRYLLARDAYLQQRDRNHSRVESNYDNTDYSVDDDGSGPATAPAPTSAPTPVAP